MPRRRKGKPNGRRGSFGASLLTSLLGTDLHQSLTGTIPAPLLFIGMITVGLALGASLAAWFAEAETE